MIGSKNCQNTLLHTVSGDLDWLSDHIKDLLVHRASIVRDQQISFCRTVFLMNEQNRRDSAADAPDRAASMGSQATGVHYAKITFTVNDFATKCDVVDDCGLVVG